MDYSYDKILRSLSRPTESQPTGQTPVLQRLSGIRAVMFDVYGTLFLSQSGEVGIAPETACGDALGGAMRSLGETRDGLAAEGARRLVKAIQDAHDRSRRRGIEYPEVDIVEIWREVVGRLAATDLLKTPDWSDGRLQLLAVEYEGRVNPVWPMPGLRECLSRLSRKGLALGIISNAQFYTPYLFQALLGGPSESLGFDPALEYYSYRHGQAKPGSVLYKMAAGELSRRGIEPQAVLYVGNDMLNDVCPAAAVGFRTALFAGDARSFRPRPLDPRLAALPNDAPDLVLTELGQLPQCV